jgi:hypothetical protein
MINRPADGVRVFDAVLIVLTGSFEAAVVLHGIIVFAFIYGIFRIAASRFGPRAAAACGVVAFALYLTLYVGWGVPAIP